MIATLYLVLQIFGALHVIHGSSWSYSGSSGPAAWSDSYTNCGHNAQSPIDLPDKHDMAYNNDMGTFTMTNYDSPTTMTLKNNGHGAQVDLTGDVTLSGGGLDGTFKAAQFHFHWGSVSTQGSEHTYHGTMYPMELHIVHYNTKYADIGTAIDKADGLAVLGFFYEIQATDNGAYTSIITGLSSVSNKDDAHTLTPFDITTLLPSDMSKFYRYQGSLTTPACFESVTWTLLQDTIKISEAQMETFRLILDSTGNVTQDNYRPVQPRNSRNVYVNYQAYVSSWSHSGEKGPDHWVSAYSGCGGNSQSPIDIPAKSVMTPLSSLGNFVLNNYDDKAKYTMTLKNTGHGVQVDLGGGLVTAANGGLVGTFVAAQFHFHWGSTSAMGSEHNYNGQAYPMEMHIVHYNSKYGDINTAIDKSDGLAVFGFFFEIGSGDNGNYNEMLGHLEDIKYSKSIAAIDSFNVRNLMSTDLSRYYRYQGSLTTPGCYESVTWTIFEDTITISESQMAKFRAVLDTNGNVSVNNYRPTRPLNNRIVYISYDPVVGAAPSLSSKHFMIVLLATFITLF